MLSVGDNIDAYCLKCKMVLAHVILFKVDGVVNRVKCKTCGAEHKYRGAKTPVKKSETAVRAPRPASKAKTARKETAGDAPLMWDLKSRSLPSGTPIRDYAIGEQFQAGNVINHPVFGVGFVEKVLSDKSISVLFHDAVRLMGMNVA
ncbi:MAG: hypothetical protein EG826_02815 [Deltaproteobacteria bacterium]|nr:hypothetical protein [Deltaproteobacteria bacterium]